MISAALRKMSRRRLGVMVRHVLKASAADSTAVVTSWALALEHEWSTSPVTGDLISNRCSVWYSLPFRKKGTV